jgi:hypothetical protein
VTNDTHSVPFFIQCVLSLFCRLRWTYFHQSPNCHFLVTCFLSIQFPLSPSPFSLLLFHTRTVLSLFRICGVVSPLSDVIVVWITCVCVILFRRRSIDAVELFISLLPFVLCLPFGKRNLLFFFLPQLVFFFLLLFRVFSHLRWTGNLLPFVSPQLFRRPKTFTMKRGCVIHKPSIRRPTIQNVVATVSVGQAIDLRLIREKARNAEYNPRVRDS